MYANENSMKKLFPESYTDTNNYLNFLVQVQASLSGINYMRYEEGEDGELKDTSLHKAGNSVSKVMIERLINARFSKHVTTHHNNIASKYDVKYENGIIQFSLVDVASILTVSYNPKDGDISFEVYDGLDENTDQLQDENIHLWENEVR
jgi:hypothetical protein